MSLRQSPFGRLGKLTDIGLGPAVQPAGQGGFQKLGQLDLEILDLARTT